MPQAYYRDYRNNAYERYPMGTNTQRTYDKEKTPHIREIWKNHPIGKPRPQGGEGFYWDNKLTMRKEQEMEEGPETRINLDLGNSRYSKKTSEEKDTQKKTHPRRHSFSHRDTFPQRQKRTRSPRHNRPSFPPDTTKCYEKSRSRSGGFDPLHRSRNC